MKWNDTKWAGRGWYVDDGYGVVKKMDCDFTSEQEDEADDLALQLGYDSYFPVYIQDERHLASIYNCKVLS